VPLAAAGPARRLHPGHQAAAVGDDPRHRWPPARSSSGRWRTPPARPRRQRGRWRHFHGRQRRAPSSVPPWRPAPPAGSRSGQTPACTATYAANSSTIFSVQFLVNVAAAPPRGPDDRGGDDGGTYPLWVLTSSPPAGSTPGGWRSSTAAGTRQVVQLLAFSINGVDEPYGRDLYCHARFAPERRQRRVRVHAPTTTDQGAASGATGSYAGTLGTINAVTSPEPVRPGRHRVRHQVQPDRRVGASSKLRVLVEPQAPTTRPATSDGFTGEDPVARLIRLCAENGIDLVTQGDSVARGVTMGPQGVDTLYNLLNECVDVDQGVLYETRTQLGVTYRAASCPVQPDRRGAGLRPVPPVGTSSSRKPDDQYIRNM
jgi:hypothetical protein